MTNPLLPPGWFAPDDEHLFHLASKLQEQAGVTGDLLEVGVYWGRSALTLAKCRQGDERLVLLDIFDTAPDASANTGEMKMHYSVKPPPSADEFLVSWRQHQRRDPDELVVGPSALLADRHDLDGSFRMIHVDGSHTYEIVRDDIRTARRLAQAGAVVIFDDFRTEHAPGVAAAVWEAVLDDGLVPLCTTQMKMYATWDPERCPLTVEAVVEGALRRDRVRILEGVVGHRLALISPTGHMIDPYTKVPSLAKRIALAVLPPVLVELVHRTKLRLTQR